MDDDLHFVSPGITAEIKSLQQTQIPSNGASFTFTLLNKQHAFFHRMGWDGDGGDYGSILHNSMIRFKLRSVT